MIEFMSYAVFRKLESFSFWKLISVTSSIFSVFIVTYWSRSFLLCSCNNPNACINSCATVPLSKQVVPLVSLCIDRSCLPLVITWPTFRKTKKLFLLIILTCKYQYIHSYYSQFRYKYWDTIFQLSFEQISHTEFRLHWFYLLPTLFRSRWYPLHF